MMRSNLFTIFIACTCFNFALAERWAVHLHKRDGLPSTTTNSALANTASNTPTESGESSGSTEVTITSSSRSAGHTTSTTLHTTSTSVSISATPTTVASSISEIYANLNGASPTAGTSSSSTFNSTATPNELPITPKVTPAFAVAGVILMISGLGYTLIGIKNKWLHISLSAGYLASLATTVLIIYVMNPPVSNAIQGAYLVAVVMTGIILGGASCVFTELTEGLGTLLGGFCLSMWFMVLKPGGLVTSTGGIAALIAAFSLTAFCTSFSRVTRPYGLIVFVSFGGATAIVLGVDCFSRAGLKEFWAYIWNLNDNLFPVGATTYPLTRGLRVEIAAIVILFLFGVASQMKIWKIIKERREQRAAEQLEEETARERAEAALNRIKEARRARDQDRWEAVYGDKDRPMDESSPRDSGVADVDSQKKGPTSTVASVRTSAEDENIEMRNISPQNMNSAGLVVTTKAPESGVVTVRVARDIEPPQLFDENGVSLVQPVELPKSIAEAYKAQQVEEEKKWVVGSDGEARLERRPSQTSTKVTKSPEIVPLPFKVPSEEDEKDDDRSSVATFADEEQASNKKRLSNRLSTGSDLLRRLSQRSMKSKRSSLRFSMTAGESTEDLVIPHHIEDDRRSSLAATMDGLSDEEDRRSVRSSMQTPIEGIEQHQPHGTTSGSEEQDLGTETPNSPTCHVNSVTEGEMNRTTGEGSSMEPVIQQSLTSSTDPKSSTTGKSVAEPIATEPRVEITAPSVASKAESKPSSITADRLPAQLSKVVMSYHTNEWAKHLSIADAPELEKLDLPAEDSQAAAPLDIEGLKQTSEPQPQPQPQHQPQPPISRSTSAMSRRSEYQEPVFALPVTPAAYNVPGQLPFLNTRPQSMRRMSSVPNIPRAIVESPIEANYPSRMPPNANAKYASKQAYSTLTGKRDTLVRKSSTLGSSNTGSDPYSPGRSSNSTVTAAMLDDDNISLSARRSLIRQSSLNFPPSPAKSPQSPLPYTATSAAQLPHRQSSAPNPLLKEQQLRSFRNSVQAERQSIVPTQANIEEGRKMLWEERRKDDVRRRVDEKKKGEREREVQGMMRRGDMLEAHREGMRRMQGSVKH